MTVYICRGCDEPIAEAEDGVLVGHDPGSSGPGWPIWVHRGHEHLVKPDPVLVRALVRVLVARRREPET